MNPDDDEPTPEEIASFLGFLRKKDEMQKKAAKVKQAASAAYQDPEISRLISPSDEEIVGATEAGVRRGTAELLGFERPELSGMKEAFTHRPEPSLSAFLEGWQPSDIAHPIAAYNRQFAKGLNPRAYERGVREGEEVQTYEEEPSPMGAFAGSQIPAIAAGGAAGGEGNIPFPKGRLFQKTPVLSGRPGVASGEPIPRVQFGVEPPNPLAAARSYPPMAPEIRPGSQAMRPFRNPMMGLEDLKQELPSLLVGSRWARLGSIGRLGKKVLFPEAPKEAGYQAPEPPTSTEIPPEEPPDISVQSGPPPPTEPPPGPSPKKEFQYGSPEDVSEYLQPEPDIGKMQAPELARPPQPRPPPPPAPSVDPTAHFTDEQLALGKKIDELGFQEGLEPGPIEEQGEEMPWPPTGEVFSEKPGTPAFTKDAPLPSKEAIQFALRADKGLLKQQQAAKKLTGTAAGFKKGKPSPEPPAKVFGPPATNKTLVKKPPSAIPTSAGEASEKSAESTGLKSLEDLRKEQEALFKRRGEVRSYTKEDPFMHNMRTSMARASTDLGKQLAAAAKTPQEKADNIRMAMNAGARSVEDVREMTGMQVDEIHKVMSGQKMYDEMVKLEGGPKTNRPPKGPKTAPRMAAGEFPVDEDVETSIAQQNARTERGHATPDEMSKIAQEEWEDSLVGRPGGIDIIPGGRHGKRRTRVPGTLEELHRDLQLPFKVDYRIRDESTGRSDSFVPFYGGREGELYGGREGELARFDSAAHVPPRPGGPRKPYTAPSMNLGKRLSGGVVVESVQRLHGNEDFGPEPNGMPGFRVSGRRNGQPFAADVFMEIDGRDMDVEPAFGPELPMDFAHDVADLIYNHPEYERAVSEFYQHTP